MRAHLHQKGALSAPRGPKPFSILILGILAASYSPSRAQERADTAAKAESWDVTLARGTTREIGFVTQEGTWMAVDLSPDGRWVVFDLLGHVYRMPSSGGEAHPLTQNSGVAVNFQPRYSPDGRHIAFISDRKGQNNLWIMEADGANPRAVFTDLTVRAAEPSWTPDGQYLVVRREKLGDSSTPGMTGIWMYHRDGGQGVELVGNDVRGAEWPSVSPDGKHLYFHASTSAEDPLSGAEQLRRLDLKTGEVLDITAGESLGAASSRLSSGGGVAPEVSPDGRWLAFARQIPDGTISHKGHRYGPRTALWLRDLHTGAERVVMDPIETQVAAGSKSLGVLPRYRWSADGKSILLSQGGKLRRLDLASGAVATMPFTARVKRTISEMAYRPFRISDEPFESRFHRWQTASPDGRRLAFQAVGRIWLMDLPNGTPRRLTPASFEPLEYAPAWSPDGRWLAFTSWDDRGRGHLWKAPAAGGAPQRLTAEAGDFIHPVWSPDGRQIVAARGGGATARGRTMSHNSWFDLVRVPAAGGAPEVVTTVSRPSGASIGANARRQIVRPSFGPDGRVFFPREVSVRENDRQQTVTHLVSVRMDGSDERVHAVLPFADEVVPSPDGQWVAFQEGDNVFLSPLYWNGFGGDPLRIEKRRGKFPVEALSTQGGLFPRWRDGRTVEFGNGNRYHTYRVDSRQADTTVVRLVVPRDVASGTVALTGARIIPLRDGQVIENGTVVVKGSRIACVGDCDTSGVDRVIDASGKTIIPGFIDMHSHHFREHRGIRPRRDYESGIYLAYGVTTNLDNSMWSQNVFPTAELIEAGEIIGPRAFSTGDPLYRGDDARQNEISSYDVAEDNVQRLASWGAVSVKQYQQPRRDQRQWISHAARKHGLMVTAEGGDLMYNIGMIMDGQTGWEHPMSYVPLYSDVAKFFGQAKAVYSPTLVVAGPGPWNIEYFFQESDVWKDPKQRRWMPWRMLMPHTRRRILRPETDYSYALLAQGLADIIAEGGYGSIGSHGEHHGLAAQWEVWMLASALGPMKALEVASRHGAHFLGAERDLGTLEQGKLADLLVLNSNPLADIRNTADIQYVMKGGTLYEAATLDEIWPESRPFGEYYWVDPDALRDDDRPVDYWDRRGSGR